MLAVLYLSLCWNHDLTVPCVGLDSLLWESHKLAVVKKGSDEGWRGWRKATEGKGTDGIWVMEESDMELGTPA